MEDEKARKTSIEATSLILAHPLVEVVFQFRLRLVAHSEYKFRRPGAFTPPVSTLDKVEEFVQWTIPIPPLPFQEGHLGAPQGLAEKYPLRLGEFSIISGLPATQ